CEYMTGLSLRRWGNVLMLALAAMILTGTPAYAQIQTIDPNEAIDADLGTPPKAESPPKLETSADPAIDSSVAEPATDVPATSVPSPAADSATSQQDDLIGAAEGVFGKGAEGLARLIEDVLKKQGQPNGYIVGREGGGALLVGLRYGSGTLHHKVEGEMPVYWTGPSLGFDAGANAGNTFVLVYNLYDSEDLYRRFPSGEGVAYLVGGFNASYLRRGDIVLIPIRVGAGLRLGANVGYMKFSKKQRWLPF
ncbi:MAG: hypothetical protein RLZZ104_72, partial [Pseudomonadota bacterium]